MRLRMDLAYDGAGFHGWARQPGLRTVQGELETALAIVLRVEEVAVTCAGRTVGIPITRVVRALEIAGEELRSSGRQQVVALDDEMIPLVDLNQLLGLTTPPQRDPLPTVVTELHGRKIGLLVDRFTGQREVFVKTLAFPLDTVLGVSGATVLGDGSVVFIIDPQALLATGTTMPDHPVAGV